MPTIYIDADACPVKNEVYKVAARHQLGVKVVANSPMYIPDSPSIELVLVGNAVDAADDWIADHSQPNDIVITEDVPLAARAVKKGARVLTPKGREFTEASIGETLASRDLLNQLRTEGLVTGGPNPFQPKDRSNFLQKLETIARSVLNPP